MKQAKNVLGLRSSLVRLISSFAVVTLTLTAVVLATLTLVPGYSLREGKVGSGKAVPIFSNTEFAKNPTELTVLVDSRKVLGWISGERSFEGREVAIEAGETKQTVIVQADNTFTWYYKVPKGTEATFTVGDLAKSTRLDPPKEREPTVFFVVDRTVYRPKHKLQFAAFLRKLDRSGEFVPLAGQTVDVEIRCEKKKSLAGKLRLTSDDFGRITGFYQFIEADALDNYILSIPGYKGTATVSLAEFRKSKVKLKIDGEVEDKTLTLKFTAVDFLDKPVPGTRVDFTANVIKNAGRGGKHPLKGEDFVYHEMSSAALPELEELTEEELLLCESESGFPALFGYRRDMVVAQIQQQIEMSGKGEVEYSMDLKEEWLKGDYSVRVQGVLVDQNGREQRSTRSIELEPDAGGPTLDLAIAKRYYETGERIRITVKALDDEGSRLDGSSTLVVMRLPRSRQPWDYGYYPMYQSTMWPRHIYNGGMISQGGFRRRNWNYFNTENSTGRTMVTAVVFSDDTAEIKLSEPGAYKLVVVTQLPGGKSLRDEIGCVVRDANDYPRLMLKLDKKDYSSGEALSGEIHSRFANARILMTLRDSKGIRFWKPFEMDGTVLRFRQKLPAGLHYGCSVDVQYVEEGGRIHIAEEFIRVKPDDRILTIKAGMKEVCNPGENVKIDLEVNRKEAVDLVVSVYDQSLLGIAADRSVDITDFYLADETVRREVCREILRRKLGNVTVEAMVEQAEALLKEDPDAEGTPEWQMWKELTSHYRSNYLYSYDIATMLRLSGMKASAGYRGNWHARLDKKEKAKTHLIWELLDVERNSWRLNYFLLNDTLVLMESHPNYGSYGYWGNLAWNYVDYNGFNARADARHSVSGNAFYSVSGQSFISHMPSGMAPAELIGADTADVTVRRDFSDSAFWKANVRTDENGHASVEFELPDSLTNWQVVVTAISSDMHVGHCKDSFVTYKPIMVWPMLPRVFTEGDVVEIYASVHNRTDESQEIEVTLKVENGEILSVPEKEVVIGPKDNVPVYWRFRAGDPGFTQILMIAECDAGSDASLKRLPVVACSVEEIVTDSGFCDGIASFVVPDEVDLENSKLEITFAPSLVADMTDTLDYLVEYPHGCVEQTMSRFLPAIKVSQILEQFGIEHEGLEKKVPKCVEGGVKRLLQLQHDDGGWGWNGNGRTHEMMTPYALYGLLQAEKAGYVIGSENAIQNGLMRLRSFINNMGEKQAADRIYCMYVYAHREEMKEEWWKFIEEQLGKNKLSDYALAMALEMAVQGKKDALAGRLVKTLRSRATRTHVGTYWTTANFSRWGNNRHEITAAAMKALVAYDPDDELIPEILSYFAATKRGNRWNSTKDTAMIIYAMCDYLAEKDYSPVSKAKARFAVNNGRRKEVVFDDGLTKKIVMEGGKLRGGKNSVSFSGSSGGTMYRLVFRYRHAGRDIPPQEKGIKVTRRFYMLDKQGKRVGEIKPGDTVPRGVYIESEVTARSVLDANMDYVLVENPKPSCCEILPAEDKRFNQSSTSFVLREDKTAGVLYHHERTPRSITDRCVLHAELEGEYTVRPATVELMYRPEMRGHSGTFHFTVKDEEKVALKD